MVFQFCTFDLRYDTSQFDQNKIKATIISLFFSRLKVIVKLLHFGVIHKLILEELLNREQAKERRTQEFVDVVWYLKY